MSRDPHDVRAGVAATIPRLGSGPQTAERAESHGRPYGGVVSRLLARRAGSRLAVLVFVAIVMAAISASWLAPADPLAQRLQYALRPPTWTWTAWRNPGTDGAFLFGSDALGRDVFSRVLWGMRLSLGIAAVSVTFAMAVGVGLGVAAGFRRGGTDSVIMMVTDMWLSFPTILLAIVIVAGLGSGLLNTLLVLILTNWPSYTRIIRSEVLSLRDREFVLAARALGSGPGRIARFHILPQVVPTALTLATLQFGVVVILEATLSFLGLGVPQPSPSLGNLLADGRQFLWTAWWLAIFPGLAITALVWSSNILGDALRDAVDARLRL